MYTYVYTIYPGCHVMLGTRNSVECTLQPWVECTLQPWVENMIAAHGRKWRMQPTVEYTLLPSIESIKCSPRSKMESAAHGGKRALQPSVENAMCSLRSNCRLLYPPPPSLPPIPFIPLPKDSLKRCQITVYPYNFYCRRLKER